MKTVILQSFRDYDVPEWLQLCIHSVENYAHNKGYAYKFIGDEFFDLTPEWARQKCKNNLFAITDVSRLIAIRNLHLEGFDKVIWIDADVLVFAPHILKIETKLDYGFAHELLVAKHENDYLIIPGINNAVMFFKQGSTTLEYYYNQAMHLLSYLPEGNVPRTSLGPTLLTKIVKSKEALFYDVGLFTLNMMQEIAQFGSDSMIKNYESVEGKRIGAANLCNFQRHELRGEHKHNFDILYKEATVRLLNTYE